VVDMARFYRLVWSMSRVIKKKLWFKSKGTGS
jgi:hypothetical protein